MRALALLILFLAGLFAFEAKVVYLKEVSTPKNIYEGMVFEASFSMLALDEFDSITTDFESSSVSVVNKDSKWHKVGDNEYINTFLFKALKGANVSLPKMTVTLIKDGVPIGSDVIEAKPVDVIKINVDDFSSVFADSLSLEDSRVAVFNETLNIVIFMLKAKNSNLNEFVLKNYAKQGDESFKGNYVESELIYYVMIPKDDIELSFRYFNTSKNRLETITVKNIPIDEKVSTQSDLKPKNTMLMTKIVVLGLFAFIFLLLFIIKRKKIYLFLAILAIGGILYYLLQKGTVTVKEGSSLYILPTFNSTVVYMLEKDKEANFLATREGYVKVEIDDKIGWVKKSAIKK